MSECTGCGWLSGHQPGCRNTRNGATQPGSGYAEDSKTRPTAPGRPVPAITEPQTNEGYDIYTTPEVYRADLRWCDECRAARELDHVCWPRKP